MAALHITDIESAINWWRERRPSPDGITACAEVRALGTVYALDRKSTRLNSSHG